MRIWIGEEKELFGFRELQMLFIKGKHVNIERILRTLVETNTRYLYFGAGKVEFEDFEKLKQLPSNVTILIETTNPLKIPKDLKCTVIYRIELPELNKSQLDVIKIESKDEISTVHLKQAQVTRLESLNRETLMYNDDKLLWEDEEQ